MNPIRLDGGMSAKWQAVFQLCGGAKLPAYSSSGGGSVHLNVIPVREKIGAFPLARRKMQV